MTSLRRRLVLVAGLSAVVYLLIFSLPYPLSQHYNKIPPVDYAKLSNYSVGGFVAYLVGLALLFGLYLLALRFFIPPRGEASRAVIGLRFVLITGAALAAVLWLSYPLGAIDVFVYAIYTRGWALHGLNPLATPPAQYPAADPWLGLAAEWIDAPSPYGPVWQVLSLGAYYAGGGDFLLQVYALKLLAIVAYLGCTFSIYRILQPARPDWALFGTLAFAWNPLVLIEVAQNAHNDIVMIFFLLAAVWALIAARRSHSPWPYEILVCVLLALSVLTKFITLVVVPFFLLALMSRSPRWPVRVGRLMGFGLLIIGLSVLGMLPMWPGWDNWAAVQGLDAAGRSILALAVLILRDGLKLDAAFDVARRVLLILYAAIYAVALWRLFNMMRRSALDEGEDIIQQALAASFSALFWLVLLVMPVFHAWYLLWCLPVAILLLPQRRPLDAMLVFSVTALVVIPYFETIRVWFPELLRNQLLGHLIGVTILAVPPIVTLLWPRKNQTPLYKTATQKN